MESVFNFPQDWEQLVAQLDFVPEAQREALLNALMIMLIRS